MSTFITIPVSDCDCPAYTPGRHRVLKPSVEPPEIVMSGTRHPILSAGLRFFPGNWASRPLVSIEARLQWGGPGQTQTQELVTASAPNAFRGAGYSKFCRLAIPQLLMLWREISEIPVIGGSGGPQSAGPVIWKVSRFQAPEKRLGSDPRMGTARLAETAGADG